MVCIQKKSQNIPRRRDSKRVEGVGGKGSGKHETLVCVGIDRGKPAKTMFKIIHKFLSAVIQSVNG